MKKLSTLIIVSLILLTGSVKAGAVASSSPSIIGVTISFSTHAYWAGDELGCQPRERGWCFHISIDSKLPDNGGVIIGEISNNPSTGLLLKVSKRTGITSEAFAKYFIKGKFNLDGPGTMSDELAKKLGLAKSYVIPEGQYNYREEGDFVIISLKR